MPAGQPKKYETVEQMQIDIDNYFKSCFIPLMDKEGNVLYNSNNEMIYKQYRPFTISGLADALDMSRRTLLNYQKQDEFFPTIMKAKRKCEIYAEERLFDRDGVGGAKFSLINNYKDWSEKKETTIQDLRPINIVNDLPQNNEE